MENNDMFRAYQEGMKSVDLDTERYGIEYLEKLFGDTTIYKRPMFVEDHVVFDSKGCQDGVDWANFIFETEGEDSLELMTGHVRVNFKLINTSFQKGFLEQSEKIFEEVNTRKHFGEIYRDGFEYCWWYIDKRGSAYGLIEDYFRMRKAYIPYKMGMKKAILMILREKIDNRIIYDTPKFHEGYDTCWKDYKRGGLDRVISQTVWHVCRRHRNHFHWGYWEMSKKILLNAMLKAKLREEKGFIDSFREDLDIPENW